MQRTPTKSIIRTRAQAAADAIADGVVVNAAAVAGAAAVTDTAAIVISAQDQSKNQMEVCENTGTINNKNSDANLIDLRSRSEADVQAIADESPTETDNSPTAAESEPNALHKMLLLVLSDARAEIDLLRMECEAVRKRNVELENLSLMQDCLRDCETDLENYKTESFNVQLENEVSLKTTKKLSEEKLFLSLRSAFQRASEVTVAVCKEAEEHYTLKQWLSVKFALAGRCRNKNDSESLALRERIQNFEQDVTKLSEKNVSIKSQILTQTTHLHNTNALSTNDTVDNGICLLLKCSIDLLHANAKVCDRLFEFKMNNDTYIENTRVFEFKLKVRKLRRYMIRYDNWLFKIIFLLHMLIRFRIGCQMLTRNIFLPRLNNLWHWRVLMRTFPRDGGGILFRWLLDVAVVFRF